MPSAWDLQNRTRYPRVSERSCRWRWFPTRSSLISNIYYIHTVNENNERLNPQLFQPAYYPFILPIKTSETLNLQLFQPAKLFPDTKLRKLEVEVINFVGGMNKNYNRYSCERLVSTISKPPARRGRRSATLVACMVLRHQSWGNYQEEQSFCSPLSRLEVNFCFKPGQGFLQSILQLTLQRVK